MSTPIPPVVSPAARALARVQRTARLNGWSIAIVAGLCTLGSLLFGDLSGGVTSLFATAAGVLELRGQKRLLRRDGSGLKLMVRAELLLLAVIALYAATRMASFDAGYIRDQLLPEMRENFQAAGLNLKETLAQVDLTEESLVPLVRKAFLEFYGAVILITVLYQGGMALWYHRKTALVTEALRTPPAVLPPPGV